jgi:phytoene dehydrogenase-like protein
VEQDSPASSSTGSASGPTPPAWAEVVVVGAGLAGLAAAARLRSAGRRVCLLEADDGPGGRVRTDLVDGFLLDRGFQVLLTSYPEVRRQLDLAALDVGPFAPGAFVWTGDRLVRVGDPLAEPSTLLDTLSAPIGSLGDKVRLLALRRRLVRTPVPELLRADETSTREHLRALGFSDRIVARFLGPLFGGIQLDPDLATSSRMFDTIFASLARGGVGVPARGMQAVPDQLAARLDPDSVHYGRRVAEITATGVRLDGGTTVDADAVVVATEGPAAAELLGLPDPGSRAVGCVWFGADRSPVGEPRIVLDGTGAGPALNVAVVSDASPGRAPAGRSLIAAACPGDVGSDGTDLDTRVRRQLTGIWGATVDDWTTLRVDRIPHGQPDQRPPLHPRRRVRLAEGRYVCGDHRDTGSIQGALFSGRRTADAVHHDLG